MGRSRILGGEGISLSLKVLVPAAGLCHPPILHSSSKESTEPGIRYAPTIGMRSFRSSGTRNSLSATGHVSSIRRCSWSGVEMRTLERGTRQMSSRGKQLQPRNQIRRGSLVVKEGTYAKGRDATDNGGVLG